MVILMDVGGGIRLNAIIMCSSAVDQALCRLARFKIRMTWVADQVR
jgi:hypothetical protein